MSEQTIIGKSSAKFIKAVELMVSDEGTSIEELENALSLKRRSVFRLLDTLKKELKFPITVKRGKFGGTARYFLEESYLSKLKAMAIPNMSFSLNEVILLQFLLAQSAIFHDTEILEDITLLKKKLSLFLPEESGQNTTLSDDNLFSFSLNAMKSYKGKEHIIDTLMTAVKDRLSCNVTYHSFSTDTVKTYPVHPLKIIPHRGGLYALVHIPKHDVINPLAVERIQALELTGKTFRPPPNIKTEAILKLAFDITINDPITAVIRFPKETASYIRERHWSNHQSIEDNKDGSCILTITTSGRNDLMYWVLSWGHNAEVLSPESFRQLVKTQIEKMGKVYR
jgi:predicted DNA-binding transcriptional regulator YafY